MNSTELVSNLVLLALVASVAAGALPAAGAGFDSTTQTESLELSVTDRSTDTITVDITTSATDVAGLETNVTFDPSLVRVVSVDGVDLGDPVTNVDNERGWVFISQAQASGVDHPTTTRITFEIVADGTAPFDVVDGDTSLFDSESSDIPVSTTGTTVDTTPSDGDDSGDRDDDSGDDDRTDESRPNDDDDDAGTYGEDADEGSDAATDDGGNDQSTEDEQSGEESDGQDDEQVDEQPAGASSSFVTNLGIVVVLVGIILAVAVLAIDQR